MTKEITLTQGKVALVDDDLFEELSQFKWHFRRDRKNGGYAQRTGWIDGKTVILIMHREIVGALPGEEVDHRNLNKLDNQRNNLRRCTNQENQRNTKKAPGCSSRYKGVSWSNACGKWRAYIYVNEHQINLGCHNSERDAARAYDHKARELFGEFARLNLASTTDAVTLPPDSAVVQAVDVVDLPVRPRVLTGTVNDLAEALYG